MGVKFLGLSGWDLFVITQMLEGSVKEYFVLLKLSAGSGGCA